MKNVILAILLMAGTAKAATNIEYNCGRSFGVDAILKITDSDPGSAFDLAATMTAPGPDPVTGTFLRSRTINMEGSLEMMDLGSGKDQAVYLLNEVGNPTHQLAVEKGTQINKSYKVLVIDVKNQSQESMKCKLVN